MCVNKPLVSVIVPHKNDYKRLCDLLVSVPETDSVEVIVVDDYSERFKDVCDIVTMHKYARVIANDSCESNAGVARNIGLDDSKGEWLLFADSDDFFVKEGFVALLNDVKDFVGNDIVFFPPGSINEVTGLEDVRHNTYKKMLECYNRTGDEESLRYKWSPPWSKLIKTELIRRNNIRFSSQGASNDVLFSLLCGVCANKILVMNYVLYVVRRRRGSITSSLTAVKAYDRLRALVEKNDVLLQKQLYSALNLGLRYFFRSFTLSNLLGELHLRYLRQLPLVLIRKLLS